jgi:hypothetical protein
MVSVPSPPPSLVSQLPLLRSFFLSALLLATPEQKTIFFAASVVDGVPVVITVS